MFRRDFKGAYVTDENNEGYLELNGKVYEIPSGQTYSRLEEHLKRLARDLCQTQQKPS